MPAHDYVRRTPAEIHWEGDSKEVLTGFPGDVKLSLGYSLRRLQNGELPACETRLMASIGKGVWELKESDERAWYRVVYIARIGNIIHVLHCFEKESRKTDKRDIATARARLKQVLNRIQGEKNR
ncbi:MAG: type II toxin-antitoxin system RelE/ParE family toxin [Terriglobales bacterium]